MNWYFEKEGVSQGPIPDAEMEARLRNRDLLPTDLVWHVGRESWDTLALVRPEWVKGLAQPQPSPDPVPEPAPEVEAPAEIKPRRETPVRAATPAPSRLKPQAPSSSCEPGGKGKKKPAAETAPAAASQEDEAKPGLLKRLFGGGKKKKS